MEHHAHHPGRDGFVNDAGCRQQRDGHQDGGAQAIGPERPAEDQPPQEDDQPQEDSAEHPVESGSRHDDG
jgi:hypothetical protein